MKKNILWILLGLAVLAVLIYLTRRPEEMPHYTNHSDSISYEVVAKSPEYGGETPKMGYNPVSPKRAPSEDFIGKRFHVCLEMIGQWDDSEIFDMGDGIGGVTFLEFRVNKHHHYLTFSRDICETDEIIK